MAVRMLTLLNKSPVSSSIITQNLKQKFSSRQNIEAATLGQPCVLYRGKEVTPIQAAMRQRPTTVSKHVKSITQQRSKA